MMNRPSAGSIIEAANRRERRRHRESGTSYRHLAINWWWSCPFCSVGGEHPRVEGSCGDTPLGGAEIG